MSTGSLRSTISAGGQSPGEVPDDSGVALTLRRLFFAPLTRVLKGRVLALTRRANVPIFGVVYHRGWRSGRPYATPVAVRSTGDGFMIALTFGAGAGWCRNVRAAGGCVVRVGGAEFTTTDPQVVHAASARADVRAAFSPLERVLLRLMGTRHFLRLRLAGPAPRQATR